MITGGDESAMNRRRLTGQSQQRTIATEALDQRNADGDARCSTKPGHGGSNQEEETASS
jgi:hypothetical protein